MHTRITSITKVIITWLPICFLIFWLCNVPILTGYPSLDWYGSENSLFVRWFVSTSSLHAAEILIMIFSYYIHRNFPKEFSLSKELLLNLVTGWVINHIIDFSNAFRSNSNISRCVFQVLHGDAGIDILRCLMFLIIIYATTISSFTYFPLPFTWVFEDFSKFIFEPKCVRVFIKYLNTKEPNKKVVMDKLMKLYIIEFDKSRPSTSSDLIRKSRTNSSRTPMKNPSIDRITSGTYGTMFQGSLKADLPEIFNRVQFLDLMNDLELSFKRFKKTHSFVALYTKLKTFEDITEHAASGW